MALTSAFATMNIFGWVGASLTRKVGLGLSVMAVLMLFAIGAIFLQVRQQSGVASVVTVATDQRLAVQRIVDRAAKAIGGDLRAGGTLQQAANEFDSNLKALRDGGLAFGTLGTAFDLPVAPAYIQSQFDRIDQIWQPIYRNATVVSETAPAGRQVQELALQVTGRFPALFLAHDRALETLELSGESEVDLNSSAALTGVGQALSRMRFRVSEIAQDPRQNAPDLAEDSGNTDQVLRVLLNGDPALALRPVGGALRRELLDPINGLSVLWDEFYEDIKALIPVAEEFAEGLEAAEAIAASSEPLVRQSTVAVGMFEREAREKIDQIQWFLVALTGVFLYICAMALWVTWRTIRPLERLTRATTVIAGGDLSTRVEVGSRDEIGMLADSFNKMTEDLQRRDIELAAVNEELEAFNYSVSHDLRSPLRSIDGFSQALLEDYGDKLDEQGKDYLGRTRAASQRMGILIDDLLNLSRVTRGDIRREQVDLSSIARLVATELQQEDSGRQVTFEVAEGAVTMGDPHLLRTVLDNLMGNAWKFTGNHPTATIEFGVTEKDGRPVYFVRDDGAGFDMAYAANLFGAFQRLHAMTEFSGTGIGLATVQRIIHRHGGRVWAEAEVEQGATFFFTLG